MRSCEEPEERATPYQDEPGTESGSEGGVATGFALLGTVLVDTYWAGFSFYPRFNGGQQTCFKRRQNGSLVGTLLWSESNTFPYGLLFSFLVGQAVALSEVAVEPLGSSARVTEVYP